MLDNIWDYLNIWIRKKFKDSFTTDGSGNTAIRVVGDLELDVANVEQIINTTLTTADTEYPIVLPTSVKRYTIFCVDKKKMVLGFNSGDTSDEYITIVPGVRHDSKQLDYTESKTIYLKSSSNNRC